MDIWPALGGCGGGCGWGWRGGGAGARGGYREAVVGAVPVPGLGGVCMTETGTSVPFDSIIIQPMLVCSICKADQCVDGTLRFKPPKYVSVVCKQLEASQPAP